MTFWNGNAASPKNLRLFVPGEGWKNYADQMTGDGQKVEIVGARRLIESAFLNALNATNVVVLTGTGSSFSAHNSAGKLTPAGMWDIWNAAKAKVGDEVFAKVNQCFKDADVDNNIERLLTLCKLHLELHAKATDEITKLITAFVKDAETAILERVAFVDTETDLSAHAALLQKLGRRGVRKSRSKIFTTNYDLCFEEAGARHRFTFIDGFSHSLRQVYDRMFFDHDVVRRENGGNGSPDYIENVVQFYKLHGSIDWRRKGGEIVRSTGEEGEPVLIYPRSSKYQESFEAPYLDMIGAFQAALREPDTAVIVSGFGFNDDHIGRPILSAVESNMSLRLIICDPVFLDAAALPAAAHTHPDAKPTENRFLKSFMALAAGGDARLHLINGRFEDMAVVLPDLMGETDRERHVQRIRSIREEAGAQTG